jgi:hypothetical protein
MITQITEDHFNEITASIEDKVPDAYGIIVGVASPAGVTIMVGAGDHQEALRAVQAMVPEMAVCIAKLMVNIQGASPDLPEPS